MSLLLVVVVVFVTLAAVGAPTDDGCSGGGSVTELSQLGVHASASRREGVWGRWFNGSHMSPTTTAGEVQEQMS